MKDVKSSPTVKSAQRVLSILELLSKNPMGLTFTELSVRLEIPKSSLHQLLNTLGETRMIQYDLQAKKYTLGVRIWELAMAYTNHLSVPQISQPFLEQLRDRCDETVQMAILDGADVVYVAKVESNRPVQLVSQIGTRLPAYVTGLGKALLACLSQQQLLHIYPESNFTSYTSNTITTRENLLQELKAVKERGYACDLGEYSPETWCIAVPVLGFGNSAVAAISFSLVSEQVSEEKKCFLLKNLLECAEDISYRLGATDPNVWRRL